MARHTRRPGLVNKHLAIIKKLPRDPQSHFRCSQVFRFVQPRPEMDGPTARGLPSLAKAR